MKRLLIFLWLSVMISGCSGINVTQDYDTSVNFSRLKTYAWQSPAQKNPDNEPDNNSLVEMRIRTAVDVGLAAKGYKKIEDTSQADYLVAYSYYIQENIGSDKIRSGVGVGMGTGSRGSFGGIGLGFGQGNQYYEQDSLIIDAIDPNNGKLMWRGLARQLYDRLSDPEKITARFNETVEAILKKFPPEANR